MKKLLFLFFICPLLLACSCCDCEDEETIKSISFNHKSQIIPFNKNAVLAISFSLDELKYQEYILTSTKDSIISIEYNKNTNSVNVKGLKVGNTTLIIKSKDGALSDSCKIDVSIDTVKRWVVFGNSITKHEVTSFWWGTWGMAASIKDKDYVHVLNRLLESKFSNTIDFEAVNIAEWENDASSFDKKIIDQSLKGTEDIVIIRFGENVKGNTLAAYEGELSELVAYMKQKTPNACYVITGNFWTNKMKDEVQKDVAKKYNCLWIELDQLYIPENLSSLNSVVWGDDGKEHLISDGGAVAPVVANHPGDLGMENIAKEIFSVLINGEH